MTCHGVDLTERIRVSLRLPISVVPKSAFASGHPECRRTLASRLAFGWPATAVGLKTTPELYLQAIAARVYRKFPTCRHHNRRAQTQTQQRAAITEALVSI